MKKLILLLMVVSCTLLAQPETFRSMSTSGMILDDLDWWFSGMLHMQPLPDRLVDVEGVRIYSGLSNLATGTDLIFDESDTTRGGFLLGGSYSPQMSGFGVGLLTEFMDDRFYDEISLTGPGGTSYLTGEGTLEGIWSQYTDTNGDGTLDSKTTVHETASAWTDSISTNAGVFGSYAVTETVDLGLGFSLNTFETKILDQEDNGSMTVADTNLVTGEETYTLDTDGEGSFLDKRNSMNIFLSGTGEISEVMSLGGMFMFSTISSEVTDELTYSAAEDYLPGESNVYDIATWSGSESFSVKPDGSRFGGGLNFRYQLDESWMLEASGGYYSLSLSGSAEEYSASMDSSRIVSMGSLVDTTIVDMDASGGTEVDITDDIMGLGAKLTLDPSDKLTVSMGAGISTYDVSNTVSNNSDNTVVMTHSDGDDEFADPDDYVATTTWSQTEETKTTTSTMRISIPVGLEFQILPKFIGRLGANPGFVWDKETETTSIVDATPMVTETVFGDGTEQQTVESPYDVIEGTLVETDESYTEIIYSYGVGFRPHEHVQVDLMGLGNDFDQWRLSATLHF